MSQITRAKSNNEKWHKRHTLTKREANGQRTCTLPPTQIIGHAPATSATQQQQQHNRTTAITAKRIYQNRRTHSVERVITVLATKLLLQPSHSLIEATSTHCSLAALFDGFTWGLRKTLCHKQRMGKFCRFSTAFRRLFIIYYIIIIVRLRNLVFSSKSCMPHLLCVFCWAWLLVRVDINVCCCWTFFVYLICFLSFVWIKFCGQRLILICVLTFHRYVAHMALSDLPTCSCVYMCVWGIPILLLFVIISLKLDCILRLLSFKYFSIMLLATIANV